jgi:hypothetical protein
MTRYPALSWLSPDALADLDEAIRITNAQPVEHIDSDLCQRCGGYGCDQCRDCDCPRCKHRTPDYIRDQIQKWRPDHADH